MRNPDLLQLLLNKKAVLMIAEDGKIAEKVGRLTGDRFAETAIEFRSACEIAWGRPPARAAKAWCRPRHKE